MARPIDNWPIGHYTGPGVHYSLGSTLIVYHSLKALTIDFNSTREQINKLVIGRQISRDTMPCWWGPIFYWIRSKGINISKLAHLTALNFIRFHSVGSNVLIHHSIFFLTHFVHFIILCNGLVCNIICYLCVASRHPRKFVWPTHSFGALPSYFA